MPNMAVNFRAPFLLAQAMQRSLPADEAGKVISLNDWRNCAGEQIRLRSQQRCSLWPEQVTGRRDGSERPGERVGSRGDPSSCRQQKCNR